MIEILFSLLCYTINITMQYFFFVVVAFLKKNFFFILIIYFHDNLSFQSND